MERQGDEIHIDTDEARAGSSPNVVRWILAISLVLAIVLLSVTWITGALSMGEQGSVATTSDRESEVAGTAQEGTDSIVTEGMDEIDAAPPASEAAAAGAPSPAAT